MLKSGPESTYVVQLRSACSTLLHACIPTLSQLDAAVAMAYATRSVMPEF